MNPADHMENGHDLTAQEARQGVTLGAMRYVLAISTVAVAVIFALIWFNGV